jgi:hypothetical protein
MAEKHDLNITISETGEIEIKVEGINGPKCIELTKDLENELGQIISREKTSSYYKQDVNINTDIKKSQ